MHDPPSAYKPASCQSYPGRVSRLQHVSVFLLRRFEAATPSLQQENKPKAADPSPLGSPLRDPAPQSPAQCRLRGRTAILFQWFPGRLIPDRRRLTLIADADSGDCFRCNTGLCHQRFYRLYCIPVNLIQIMGHPSLFIDNLPVRQVGTAE